MVVDKCSCCIFEKLFSCIHLINEKNSLITTRCHQTYLHAKVNVVIAQKSNMVQVKLY